MSESKILKALIVEDQELFRNAVADELSFFGFEVVTAEDGLVGLGRASKEKFDLILSDIRMPNRDGKWFLRELRKLDCETPFVFMTGFADLTISEAYEMGADGFLGKPFPPDRLSALISKLCRPLQTRWSNMSIKEPSHTFSAGLSSTLSEKSEFKVALGRGGFYLTQNEKNLFPGDSIRFEFNFESEPLKNLVGIGTVNWKMDRSKEGTTSGYGIEIEYLEPSCVQNWVTLLNKKKFVSFIPKSMHEFKDAEGCDFGRLK